MINGAGMFNALMMSYARVPFADVNEALRLASTPGAADKVVVTFT